MLFLFAATKAASFIWEKNGDEIEENIENDDEKSKLGLKNIMLTDSGRYTCIGNFDGEVYEDFVDIYVHGKTFLFFIRNFHKACI